MIGDSKTAAAVNTWPDQLVSTLDGLTVDVQTWRQDNVGLSASTAGYWAANLSNILVGQKDNHAVVLVNLGVNDFATATETQWKADMLNVLDAVKARWPAAEIYLMRPWKRNFNAKADTFAGWIADLIASRSFLHAGPDERVWLRGSDDGAAMTTDGIHYNAAAQVEAATQWRAVLGY